MIINKNNYKILLIFRKICNVFNQIYLKINKILLLACKYNPLGIKHNNNRYIMQKYKEKLKNFVDTVN